MLTKNGKIFFLVNIHGNTLCIKKVKVGNDQEMAQSERNSHSKNRGGKSKLTIRVAMQRVLTFYQQTNNSVFAYIAGIYINELRS